MSQTVKIEDECGFVFEMPTAMPEGGSILHHASLIDTVSMIADAVHDVQHAGRPCVAGEVES